MIISDLTYGGRNAWAYKKLDRGIELRNKFLSLLVSEDPPLEFELAQIDEEQASFIVEGEFIDLADVKNLAGKIKRLGEKRALKLIKYFGTIDRIKKANIIELKMIGGIGDTLAKRIRADL